MYIRFHYIINSNLCIERVPLDVEDLRITFTGWKDGHTAWFMVDDMPDIIRDGVGTVTNGTDSIVNCRVWVSSTVQRVKSCMVVKYCNRRGKIVSGKFPIEATEDELKTLVFSGMDVYKSRRAA